MSADNYNVVRRLPDGRWYVWLNLSASQEMEWQLVESAPRGKGFDTEEAAVAWAEAQGYTEYGTNVI